MEISPATFRDVEFREKRHGYHPEDVDRFLEEVAVAVEPLQEELRRARQRADKAEQVASEASRNDEALRRTLVLGQRTADQAVEEARMEAERLRSDADQAVDEARAEAERLRAAAESQAHAALAEAENRVRRLEADVHADVQAQLAGLEATRRDAQEEVDALWRWAAGARAELTAALQDAMATVGRVGAIPAPPSSTPLELPPTSPVDGAPVDGAPADGAPVDGAPADGAPVDEAPADGTAVTGDTGVADAGPGDDPPGDGAPDGPRSAPEADGDILLMDDPGPATATAAPAGGSAPPSPGSGDADEEESIDVDPELRLDPPLVDPDTADGRRFSGRLRRRR